MSRGNPGYIAQTSLSANIDPRMNGSHIEILDSEGHPLTGLFNDDNTAARTEFSYLPFDTPGYGEYYVRIRSDVDSISDLYETDDYGYIEFSLVSESPR